MSERRAWICTHKQCVPPRRVFMQDDSKPHCQEHGNTMIRQPNNPYMQGPKTGKPKRVKPKRPAGDQS